MDERFQETGFDFTADGYFTDLVSREPPTGPVPAGASQWEVWEHALRSAVHGDFGAMPRVVEIQQDYSKYFLRYNASLLLEDAITDEALELLHQRMHGCDDPLLIIDYCKILAAVGRLEFVPRIIAHYEKLRDFSEAETISISLSDLLEPKIGELCLPAPDVSTSRYRALALARCEAVRKAVPDPRASVFRGEIFSVPRLARIMLRAIAANDFDADLRRRFEASTGIDCSDFYKKGTLHPLRAAARLEEFLADPRSARYVEGARYFFGRRIP